MADKKVERNVRSSDEERPTTPQEKLEASISKTGTLNMSNLAADKARSALLDRFREREERYRREQAAAAQAAMQSPSPEESEKAPSPEH